jgi:peptidoglycan/LPS O-acetylase OafA/YrhL
MIPLTPVQPSQSTFLPALTGLRAFAALLVLMLHAEQSIPAKWPLFMTALSRGYLGVDLFFVLSGFIITHVYFTSLRTPARRTLIIFYWHRMIRLYPVHLAVLGALIVMVGLAKLLHVQLHETQAWTADRLLQQLALIHAWLDKTTLGWNVVSWSISAELFAYLLFPLIAISLAQASKLTHLIAVATAALFIAAIVFQYFNWSVALSWQGPPALTRVSTEFLCGSALCRFWALGGRKLITSFADAFGWLALVGYGIGASIGLPDFVLIALLAMLVLCAAASNRSLAKALTTRSVIWLGEISYSIYMVHFVVLRAYGRLLENFWLTQNTALQFVEYLTACALPICCAAILYFAVERPSRLRLRDVMGKIGVST